MPEVQRGVKVGRARKYRVLLTPEAREELEALLRKTSVGVAKLRWAKILLMADENASHGGFQDWKIAEEVKLSERQVVRIRQKFVKSGVQPTLSRSKRCDAGVSRVVDGAVEAHLVTIVCSAPPEGRDHWTLQMLCDELQRLHLVKSVCCETVRQALKKTSFNPGKQNVFAFQKRIDHAS